MSCGRHFNWSVTYFSRVRYIALFFFLRPRSKKKNKIKEKVNAINLNGIKIYAVWFRDMTSIRIFAATYTHSRHFHINNNNNNEIKYINEKETVRNTVEISDEVIKMINVGGTCNLIFRYVPKGLKNLLSCKNIRRKIIEKKWAEIITNNQEIT